MRFGKFQFKNFQEFVEIRQKANKNGFIKIDDFALFLQKEYSHLKIYERS